MEPLKKILLSQIPPKGCEIPISADEPWIVAVFNNIFPDPAVDRKTIDGKIQLKKHETNVICKGVVRFEHSPLCARCGAALTEKENIHFEMQLAPLPTSGSESKKTPKTENEIEITKEDLGFCFYKNEEIILDDILNDEIALHLPYNYYCKNNKNCRITHQNDTGIFEKSEIDPRWARLKNLKIYKD